MSELFCSEGMVAIVGVIVGAILGWVGQYIHTRIERNRRARYLALRSSIALDAFVGSCATALSYDPPECPPNTDPADNFDLPDKFQIPDDVDWTSVPLSLSRRILEIPYADASAHETVAFYWRVADGSQAREARDEEFLKLGLNAVKIAAELRRSYKLEEAPIGKWHPPKVLEDLVQKRTERLREHSQATESEIA